VIVGFAGLAGSGKNEAARGLHYRQIAFADPIRTLLLHLDPILKADHLGEHIRLTEIVEHHGWDTAKRQFPEVRRLLQDLGMGAREVLGSSVWAMKIDEIIDESEPDTNFAVTDVRFKNEVENIHFWGGKVIWIERPGVENLGGPTENSIMAADCDYIIINDGTVAQLHANVRDLSIFAPSAS
jgi:hypothetical protein